MKKLKMNWECLGPGIFADENGEERLNRWQRSDGPTMWSAAVLADWPDYEKCRCIHGISLVTAQAGCHFCDPANVPGPDWAWLFEEEE